jgi:membrane-associated phospholipid phosphatase
MNENLIQIGPAESMLQLPEIYRWGIDFIRMIQQIENPGLTALMKLISNLGAGYFFIPVILLILWWIDEKRGLRFGILLIVSAWINVFLKEVLKHPRPFHLDPSLGFGFAPGYGAPSGHAQMSLVFWLPIAAWLSHVWAGTQRVKIRRILIWVIAIFIVLLIGFTRLYLGVHFPSDLLAGWILGLILLALYFIPGPVLMEKLGSADIRARNISVAAAALLMNALLPVDRTLPALLLGFCIGYNIMKQRFPFSARGEIKGKSPGPKLMFFRCLTGFIGMAILFLGLELILPGERSLFGNIPLWSRASPFYGIGFFIRYGLLGFWASAGAPYMFLTMGLASSCGAPGSKSPGEGLE